MQANISAKTCAVNAARWYELDAKTMASALGRNAQNVDVLK